MGVTMSEATNEMKSTKRSRKTWISGIIGLVTGFLLCGIIVFTVMPSLMIVTSESKLGFDETVAALEKRIAEQGWVISGGQPMDMNKSMVKHGVTFEPRVKLVKLCKPEYAKNVLTTDRHLSTMMPCTFSIWEGDDGKVYLSKMNMALMAKLFGGNVATVMGEQVVHDEEKMLQDLLR
jgi:uncharacterized protein (DUF302 family)